MLRIASAVIVFNGFLMVELLLLTGHAGFAERFANYFFFFLVVVVLLSWKANE